MQCSIEILILTLSNSLSQKGHPLRHCRSDFVEAGAVLVRHILL